MPSFNRAYVEKINSRIGKSISSLAALRESFAKGRVIPDEEDLDVGTGRALNLAVLFLDICKFTSWPQADTAQQQDVLSVFNVFMTEMMRIAEDHGGEVEKNTGDGLMAYFSGEGDSAASDANVAAVSSALMMFYASEKMINPMLRRDGFNEVNFRIGIDYGPVTIAVVGGRRRFKSRVAIGTTAVIANRILRECGSDEVVVGDMVYNNLPMEFKQHCSLLKSHTGFTYLHPQRDYPYYKYIARRREPGI